MEHSAFHLKEHICGLYVKEATLFVICYEIDDGKQQFFSGKGYTICCWQIQVDWVLTFNPYKWCCFQEQGCEMDLDPRQ